MRSLPSIFAVFALALASAIGTPASGQATSDEGCGLERRNSPWRTACYPQLHIMAASPEASQQLLAPAATISGFARSRFPSDRDNGAVWAGKGLSFQLAMGVGGRLGPLRYGLFPAVHWSQNRDFAIANGHVAGYSQFVYPWIGPQIDWPQRMGSTAIGDVTPGQSFLELTGWSRAAVGFSTENVWWGPSARYPMLLGATSEGFPHLYVRSPSIALGPARMLVRTLFGRLTESDYYDSAPSNDRDLLSALRVEIGLASLPGARIAVTSMVRQRWNPQLSLRDVLRLVPISTAQGGPGDGVADGIGAVTVAMPLSDGARLHGTWGRGDFFANAEDLFTEPEHNQFWGVGFHQEWKRLDGAVWALSTEYASSAATPAQFGIRQVGFSVGLYRHSGNTQGHSHRGQLLGASIGPGSRAAFVSLDRTVAERTLGVLVERVLWDVDGYSLDLRDKFPRGQDREWRVGGRIGTGVKISGIEHLRLDAFGGASLRWNRQYVRFTVDLFDYPERETNFWLDLRLAWTPES